MTTICEPLTAPFTVLIDSAENDPFTFDGLRGDAKDGGRPIYVPTMWAPLGRHPESIGDYSIEGCTDQIGVERKSREDIVGTVLGFENDCQRTNGLPGRRERFERELANLAALPWAAVVVEATIGDCIRSMPNYGSKPVAVWQKVFHRSILAMAQDYRVPWHWLDTRQLAEITTYRLMERFWRKTHGR